MMATAASGTTAYARKARCRSHDRPIAWSMAAVWAATVLLLASMLGMPSVGLASIGLDDGTYAVEVVLTGGSGRASVSSPAEVTVSGGQAAATVVWSSPNYDQMVVEGVQYLPINEEGNSTFVVPVASFDEPIAVSAETTAMSEPHMIDYTLTFDSSTAQKVRGSLFSGGVVAGASTVLGLAAVFGAIYVVQRRGRVPKPLPGGRIGG